MLQLLIHILVFFVDGLHKLQLLTLLRQKLLVLL